MNTNSPAESSSDGRTLISQQMIAIRSRGLLNARDLSEEVERLGDWREHVRAFPVPLVLAAATLGYWIVPTKAKQSKVVSAETQPVVDRASSEARASSGESKAARSGGLSGAAFGFIGSLAANAIRSYISEQLHSLIQGDSQHDQQQRKTSPRFSQR